MSFVHPSCILHPCPTCLLALILISVTYVQDHFLCEQRAVSFFLPLWMPSVSLSCLIALAKTSSEMWNGSGEREQTVVKSLTVIWVPFTTRTWEPFNRWTLTEILKQNWELDKAASRTNCHGQPRPTSGAALWLASGTGYGTAPPSEIPDSTSSGRPSPFFYKPVGERRKKNFRKS